LALGAFDSPAGDDKGKLTMAPEIEQGRMSTSPSKGWSEVKSRTFDFTYDVTITGLEKDKEAKLWVPVAQTNDDQQVTLIGHAVKSGARRPGGKFTSEKEYGNVLFFVETEAEKSGKVNLNFSYRVTRREVKGETGKTRKENADTIRRFMQPDKLVPIDGKPLDLLKGHMLPDDPMKKARVLYDVVNNHMKYDKKGKEWGRGDSVWACDSRYGNCTDFHSLFISLARSQHIPAKFELGFPIPT
jgi:transglutaminase-like putative cysteine protease